MSMQRAACLGGLLAASLILVGCESDNTAIVKGTVKFDGKLIENGSINFIPVDGKTPDAGIVIKDGQYSVKVPVGPMKVSIGGVLKVVGMKPASEGPGGKGGPKYAESIPKQFSDRDETELRFEVKPGVNQKDWDLKSE